MEIWILINEVLLNLFFFNLKSESKHEGEPKFRLEASLSSWSRHHEQSSPSRVEEIYGQEVIIEIKWW